MTCNASLPEASPAFELHFPSLFGSSRSMSFPCDAKGCVALDALSDRARNNYLLARALMGRDFGFPTVEASQALRPQALSVLHPLRVRSIKTVLASMAVQ